VTRRKGASKRSHAVAEKPVVLVFGESEHDTRALAELLVALCPTLQGMVRPRSRPPILVKDAKVGDIPGRAQAIAALIDAERVTCDVVCVFAHEDCDAVEPAHEGVARKIENAMAAKGYHVHAVAPAWEMETWWFQWPEALAAYRPTWRRVTNVANRDLGRIENAKEELRRALRPAGSASRTRDYSETDSPGIAERVRRLGVVRNPQGRSASFQRFVQSVDGCCEVVSQHYS